MGSLESQNVNCRVRGVRRRACADRAALRLLTALLCLMGVLIPLRAQASSATVLGSTTYTRTTGDPNQYTTTFTVPAWIVSPYDLHIVNGNASGKDRVSSATITLNGVQIVNTSNFNQNVATLDINVTLQASDTLQVTLASVPGSYLTINVSGANADTTPPLINVVSPGNGGYTSSATPGMEVTFSDPVGAGQPAASGVDSSTFKATIDGVDRTSLFTVRSGDASATIPANLALSAGSHTLTVSVQDHAGNTASATSKFTVDLSTPQIQIVQPALGFYLNTTSPTISIQYSDSAGLNLSTLKILINGVDNTSAFTKTASSATAAIALPQGANQILAQIQNLAGTQASASTSFNIDTKPPTISFSSPAANSYQAASTAAVTVQYADDQAIDTTKLQVTVDGNPVGMTTGSTSATGSAANLANGPHTLAASIKDLAGNVGTAQEVFNVDTTVPAISVSSPAPNALVNTHTPTVTISYYDAGGVNTSTLKVTVNGTDETSLFTAGSSSATAQLTGAASLADGNSTITAQISNYAGTVGSTSSTFLIDTTPPTISFQAPASRINSNTPTVTLNYSDSGSGVNPYSLTVTLDGADVSTLIAPGVSSATGVLQLNPVLPDGTHQLSATVADRAGNRSQPVVLSFIVDTTPPTLTFAAPANNSFTNNTTPPLLLTYGDGTGTGVDPTTVHVKLQQGTSLPVDITNYFQIGPQQASGTIPAASSLANGTYVLTAAANDLAGNAGTAASTFVVDTVAPTAAIQSPAANAIFSMSAPNVALQYQDDNSGVNTVSIVFTVDGVNQTSILTIGATQATGTLPALADGVHTIQLTVFDRAGNSSTVVSQTFTTDTTPPLIGVSQVPPANAAGWNNSSVTVIFTCTDSGSGIATCPAPIVVATPGAKQSFCGQAVDAAGNSSQLACAVVSIDETPPTITASASPAPNAAGWNTTAVTVSFTCADSLSGVATCPPAQTISAPGAGQVVSGSATDVAGNSASAQLTINISKTPPLIVPVVTPSPNAAGWNNTNVTVSFTCTAGGAPIVVCPPPQTISTEGASIPVTGVVTDAAGATATATVVLKLDKTPPTLIPSISPAPNAGGWETSPVTVRFTCTDSLSGVATCPPATQISSDGANQAVSGTATDIAGNTVTVSANVNLEQSKPTISASVSPLPNSAGWNNTNVTVTFTCTQSVSSITSCTSPQTVSQGVGQVITGTVQDQAGNQATTSVTLNVDQTPPTILQLTAPSQLSPGQSGSATLSVTDTAAVTGVVFQLNGVTIGTVTAAPYTINVTAPSNASSGSTLTLTAAVTDIAGNSNSASKGIQVVSAGVIVGEVLSDLTGLPLAGANLQVIGQPTQSATTDAAGRYSIPVTSSQLFLSISEPANSGSGTAAMVTVERQVAVQSGVGTVPLDARMTSLAAPTVITAAGGTVGSGAIVVTVPAGGATTSYYLTPLSQQGLPGLLPLGWSPVAAFDLQTNISTSAALSANFTGLPAGTLYLVSYSYNVHAWNLVTPSLSATKGALTVNVPSTGDYALVMPDAGNASIQIPAIGQPLTGVAVVTLPTNASSTGSLSPANIAPTGGTSMASLAVQSSTSLPSGTVIQGKVTETYTLTNGQLISDEPRYEDILLYQNPAPASGSAAGATFPVTPSQTFQVSQLASGDVHLDILSGREAVRGATGGSDPVSVQSGDATLTVAGGSLPQDTAIAVTPETIDTFLPSTSALVPLSEYNVDFSDAVLSSGAQLTVGTAGAAPGTAVVIAQVQRVAGVPYLAVVSMAQVTATNIVSQATPGLPGITQGGDYVFYQVTVPTGFVSGNVSSGSGPVAAMVQTDALPFVAFANASGNYMVIAAAGTVKLTASIANTALAGSTTAQVTAGQTATANLTVAGQVEAATITPANGAVGVPLTAEIDITATAGFNPATVTSSSVVLTAAGSSTPIALRFVFSNGGTTLAVFPQAALQPSTQYTLSASGIANAVGGLISVPAISVTTMAITAPTYNTNALVFAMPDANGNVAISAAAGSFPAGSTILIVDQTSGVVYSLTVLNDGSVTGQMPATINDVMQVTLTDPAGNKTNFTISEFIAADGTTAVGPGGGTVNGPGGVSMIIPAGALAQGTTFQIQSLDASAFSELPSFGTAVFGGGMQITAPAMPTFNQEVKLAFPVPASAPPGAFYYVYRQITDQNNNVYFETIDHAFVQGTGANAQVVTASPPFCGYVNSYSNFQASAAASFSPLATAITKTFFLWDWDPNQPGTASQGLIVGRILQTVVNNGVTTYVPYTGPATVQLTYPPFPVKDVSIWNPPPACGGTFTIFDPHFGGGSRSVTATINGTTMQATAYEVNGIQVNDADYDVTAGLEALYKNIGRVTFTVPPATPPPPPPQINIGILNASTNQPISGIVQTGTALTITFSSNLTVQSAAINGAEYAVSPGKTPANPTPGVNYYQLSGPYSPGNPGPYSVSATAINPLDTSAAPVTVTQGFLAVQAGGSNNSLTSAPPIVINSIPVNNATGVSPLVFPEITFSEPVTNVAGNVTLVGTNTVPSTNAPDAPTLNLIGIRTDGTAANPVQAGDSITSLTIQPTSGLQFDDTYTLTLSNRIVDASGRPLSAPNSFVFSTFKPFQLGDAVSNVEVLTRPVVIGNYAYVGALAGGSSVISGPDVIDITDPANPQDRGLAASFVGRVTDAAGQANSPVAGGTGGGLLALSASFAQDDYIPSNIWLYGINASNPTQATRVGAVSATSSATQAGVALRLSVLDQFLYSSTFLQGLQVIDLNQALAEYQLVFNTNPTQFSEAVTTDGDGFGMDAIVNTIPLPILSNNAIGTATEFDLKAAYFATSGSNGAGASQPLIVSTGRLPLVVADPSAGSSGVLFPPYTTSPLGTVLTDSPLQLTANGTQYSLTNGAAVDVGTIPITQNGTTVNKTIAVLVGTGTVNGSGEPLLAVVDISQPYVPNSQPPFTLGTPYLPQPLGFYQLSANPTDVILDGTMALVGTGSNVLIVDLTNPSQPVDGGQLTGAFGSRIALNQNGILVAAGNIPAQSVQTGTLGSQCANYRATIKSNPPNLNSISVSPSGKLAWSFSAGVSMLSPVSGEVLSEDGLVLTNVQLGRRQMAKVMSVPYLLLQRSNDTPSDPKSDPHLWPRCTLSANSNSACVGLGSGYPGRSQLFSLNTTNLGTSVAVQAKYLLDQLDGDAEKDPNLPDSCVLVTQNYQFTQEGIIPFEPNGLLATGQFLPTIQYNYFTSDGGPQLVSLTAPQRFEFDARSNLPVPNVPTEAKASANATLLTCDHDGPLSAVPSCAFTGITLIPPDFDDVGVFGGHNNNPLSVEQFQTVIQGGKEILAAPGDPYAATIIDNLHWSPQPATNPNQFVELPVLGLPGCPACIHVHWRWSDALQADSIPGFVQSFFGAPVDPNFMNNNGLPFIPFGSTQDVSIAIEGSNTEHPIPPTLVSDLNTGRSLLPANLNQSPTFWFVSTGHQNSDLFFMHGGAFSSIYTNSMFYPSGGPLTINVEHSHDVSYVVTVQYAPLGGSTLPPPITQVSGTVTGTSDNIVISGASLSNLTPLGFSVPFMVSVKLTDQLTSATTTSMFGYNQPDTTPQVP